MGCGLWSYQPVEKVKNSNEMLAEPLAAVESDCFFGTFNASKLGG